MPNHSMKYMTWKFRAIVINYVCDNLNLEVILCSNLESLSYISSYYLISAFTFSAIANECFSLSR